MICWPEFSSRSVVISRDLRRQWRSTAGRDPCSEEEESSIPIGFLEEPRGMDPRPADPLPTYTGGYRIEGLHGA